MSYSINVRFKDVLAIIIFGYMQSVFGNHRYFIDTDSGITDDLKVQEFIYYNEQIPWNSARLECQKIGGDLATIDAKETLDFIVELGWQNYGEYIFNNDYWTGLIQPYDGQYYFASDCSSLTYTEPIEPGWKSDEQCIRWHKDTHVGTSAKCTDDRAFICQRTLDENCPMFPRLTAVLLDTIPIGTPIPGHCEQMCLTNSSCIGMVDTGYDCLMLTKPDAATFHTVIGTRFCNNVSQSAFKPPKDGSHTIPEHNCTSTSIILPSQLYTTPLIPSFSTSDDLYTSVCFPMTETINVTEFINVSVTEYTTVTATLNFTMTETVTEPLTVMHTVAYTAPTVVIMEDIYVTASVTEITCNVTEMNNNITNEEAEEIANEISKNLSIDTKQTHAFLRTKVSADDHRTSAKAMGYVGLVFVVVPLVLLIAADARRILQDALRYDNVYIHGKDSNTCSNANSYKHNSA